MTKYLLIWILLLLIAFYRVLSIPKPIYHGNDLLRLNVQVLTEPIRYQNAQYLRMHNLKIYLDPYPQINYGDHLILEGRVTDNKINKPKIISLTPSRNPLYNARNKIIDFYFQALPSPHDALVAGVALGSKQALSQDFWQTLKKTSTLHVVVASGMNVVLVASFLINILILFINRKKAITISLFGVWIYALLAGFDAPIIRASIMGSIALIAQSTGRLNQSFRALFITVLFMIIIKPSWIFDLGFILSFTSTLSLMLFNIKIYNKLHFVPHILREDLSTSLSAQIFVAPVIYYIFHEYNLLSPIINACVLWTIPPITIIAAISGITSFLSYEIARTLILLVYPFTNYFIKFVYLVS